MTTLLSDFMRLFIAATMLVLVDFGYVHAGPKCVLWPPEDERPLVGEPTDSILADSIQAIDLVVPFGIDRVQLGVFSRADGLFVPYLQRTSRTIIDGTIGYGHRSQPYSRVAVGTSLGIFASNRTNFLAPAIWTTDVSFGPIKTSAWLSIDKDSTVLADLLVRHAFYWEGRWALPRMTQNERQIDSQPLALPADIVGSQTFGYRRYRRSDNRTFDIDIGTAIDPRGIAAATNGSTAITPGITRSRSPLRKLRSIFDPHIRMAWTRPVKHFYWSHEAEMVYQSSSRGPFGLLDAAYTTGVHVRHNQRQFGLGVSWRQQIASEALWQSPEIGLVFVYSRSGKLFRR